MLPPARNVPFGIPTVWEVDVEEATVRAFVLPERRQRWVTLLASPAGRRKVTERLAHSPDHDLRYAAQLTAEEQKARSILATLRERGAPAVCHVISEGDLDGQDLALSDALDRVVGAGTGTLLICVPGELAYYEGEEQGDRYILHRHPVARVR